MRRLRRGQVGLIDGSKASVMLSFISSSALVLVAKLQLVHLTLLTFETGESGVDVLPALSHASPMISCPFTERFEDGFLEMTSYLAMSVGMSGVGFILNHTKGAPGGRSIGSKTTRSARSIAANTIDGEHFRENGSSLLEERSRERRGRVGSCECFRMAVFELGTMSNKGEDGLVLVETCLEFAVETLGSGAIGRRGPEGVLEGWWVDDGER